MAKKKKQEVDPQAWMFSFSDLLTNMLTFFVLLYSMSSMNDLAFEHSLGPSLRGALGVLNKGGYTSIGKPRFMPISIPPTAEFALIEDAVIKALLTKTEVQSGGESMPVSENIQTIEIYANNKFAQILFPAHILFEKNNAEILPQMSKQLEVIAKLLTKFAHPIRINGYSHQASTTRAGHGPSPLPLSPGGRGQGEGRSFGDGDKYIDHPHPASPLKGEGISHPASPAKGEGISHPASPAKGEGISHPASPTKGEGIRWEEDLSLKRASAVLHFFISHGGLAPERCSLAGYGNLRNEERRSKSADYVEIFIIKATNYTT